MLHDDLVYYRTRMACELRRARRAGCPEAANVHQQLAAAYQRRLIDVEQPRQAGHG